MIGGGDYSEDRIVPDIVRAAAKDAPLILRSPNATRPWQHVLDCLAGYFVFTERLFAADAPHALNIGPDPATPITVAEIADVLLSALGAQHGWQLDPAAQTGMREMQTLALNPARARALGIVDRLPGIDVLTFTAAWYSAIAKGEDARALTLAQIARYVTL